MTANRINVNDLMYRGLSRNKKIKPRFLYHYTSFESALKILDTGTLMLRPLSSMNDPFEFLDRNHGVFYNGCPTDKELFSMVDKNKHAHDERSNGVRLVCFSMDNKDGEILHKGWNIFSNWASYGRNHTGVCLVFEYDSLVETFNSFFSNATVKNVHKRIKYDHKFENYEDMFGKPINSFTDGAHIRHLFTKPDSFKQEQEYRFLVVDKKMNNPNTPLCMPIKTSLCGLITGYRFDYSLKLTDGIITACNNLGYNLSWFYYNKHVSSFENPLHSYAHDKELLKTHGFSDFC